ncbi:lactonase family protein [Streptomyces sp. NPDC031705]|uniref:lactonase family protein n=1 Tax=Streptomyces sp. NPDC031705 TaxID=3155729 RepID=UPI0033E33EFA
MNGARGGTGTEDAARDDRYLAYIGSFTSGGGRGITTAAVDPATGALAPLAVTATPENPSCLALGPDGRVLYAVSETERGAALAFRTGSGELEPLGSPVPVGACGPTHLSTAGGRLLTANYTSGSVSSLPLADGGGLLGPAAVLVHRGGGPDPERQEGPHAHQVRPDPSGRWVLSVDLGTDSVRVCAADPDTGELRVHAETVLRAGSGPRHLAFHPDGDVAYVLHELEPQMTVCRWNAAAGELEPVSEVPVAPEGAPGAPRAYPSVVAVSPDGRFVWAAVRGTDTLATFSLADGAEKPQATDVTECGGSWPRDLVAEPSGRRLYVANEWSGDVTWFEVDRRTGHPRRAGSVAVPAAACVVFARETTR